MRKTVGADSAGPLDQPEQPEGASAQQDAWPGGAADRTLHSGGSWVEKWRSQVRRERIMSPKLTDQGSDFSSLRRW